MTRMTGPECAVMCNLITSEARVTNRRSDGQKGRKKTCTVAVLANHILEDYCTYSPFHLFWRQRSFRRAIASSVHAAAVGSA